MKYMKTPQRNGDIYLTFKLFCIITCTLRTPYNYMLPKRRNYISEVAFIKKKSLITRTTACTIKN